MYYVSDNEHDTKAHYLQCDIFPKLDILKVLIQ